MGEYLTPDHRGGAGHPIDLAIGVGRRERNAPTRKNLGGESQAERALELAHRAREPERRLVRESVEAVDVASRDASSWLALEELDELAHRARIGKGIGVEQVEVDGRRAAR